MAKLRDGLIGSYYINFIYYILSYHTWFDIVYLYRDILKIAVEKWNTCATAGSRRGYFSATYHEKKTKLKVEDENPSNITTKVVVLSDEIGLFSDYMGNYFLNRFCRIFNVHIHYVFNTIHFQKAVWSSIYPKRLVHY